MPKIGVKATAYNLSVLSLPAPLMTSSYQAGVVHTQYTLDSWGDATAIASGKSLMNLATDAENQHIMGFGTTTPSVDSTHRDYVASNLTARVNTVMSGANRKVITFALAPAWMRDTTGQSPVDDFTPQAWFHASVDPARNTDWANLCANIASTYTDVDYFFVWNEMKGHFNDSLQRWDYERYTTMYNAVWSAVKAVRPTCKIGGPYVNIGSSIGDGSPVQSPLWQGWVDQRELDVYTYWLANKTGADFITVDGGNYDAGGTVAKPFGKYKSFMTWLRSLNNTTYPGAATLPVWIAEHYCYPPGASLTPNSTDVPRYPSAWAEGTVEAIRAGYATCMLWGAQGEPGDPTYGFGEPLGLFTDTLVSGGGQSTTLYQTVKDFHDNYSAGAAIYIPDTGNTNIGSIATTNKCTLFNKVGTTQSTSSPFTVPTTLTAYQVSTFTWSPSGYVQATDPSPGPLWTDDFTSTANLLNRRGSVTVTSGKLRGGSLASANMANYAGTYDTADHYAQVVISTLTNTSSEVGVGLRYKSSTNEYYLCLIKSTGAVEIYYFNGTSYTLKTSGTVTLGTLPGTLRGEVVGTGTGNIRLYWRNLTTPAITASDTTLTLGQPTTYEYPVSSLANVEIDSWEADLL